MRGTMELPIEDPTKTPKSEPDHPRVEQAHLAHVRAELSYITEGKEGRDRLGR